MKRYSPPIFILLVSCGTYLAYGIFNAGVGPVLGELSAQTGASLANAGTIFTALFSGSLIAQIVSGALTDHFGRKLPFVVSILLFAAGIFGVIQSHSLPALLAFGFLAGLGQGGIDLGSNLLVADAYPKNRAAALNGLHFAFGLGSSIGPALVSVSLSQFGRGMPVLSTAIVFFLMVAIFSILIRIRPGAGAPLTQPNLPASASENVYRNRGVWLLGVMLLLIVGTEFGLGSWSTIYFSKTTALSLETAALITSGFWAMVTVGRLAAAAGSKWVSPQKMLLLCLAGALAGAIVLALSHGLAVPSGIALLFIGFCYGGPYPIVISIATATFSSNSGKAVSLIVAMGTVGGLILPTLAGRVLVTVSSSAYVWLIVLVMGVMLGLSVYHRRRHEAQREVDEASFMTGGIYDVTGGRPTA